MKHLFVYKYDKVIVAIGFDALTPLKLFPDHLRSKDKLKEIRSKIDYHLRFPSLDIASQEDTTSINIHLPMLAGMSQGPGFPNLSRLGTLSDRILSAYIEQGGDST